MASHGSHTILTGTSLKGRIIITGSSLGRASMASLVDTASVSELIQCMEDDMDKYMILMGRVIPGLHLSQQNVMSIVDGVNIPWPRWTAFYFTYNATPWEKLAFTTEFQRVYGLDHMRFIQFMKTECVSVPSARTQDEPPVPQSSASATDDLWAWVDSNILRGAHRRSDKGRIRLFFYLRDDPQSYAALVDDKVIIDMFGALPHDISSCNALTDCAFDFTDARMPTVFQRIKYAYHDRKVQALPLHTENAEIDTAPLHTTTAPQPPVRISGEDVETDIERLECAVCKENEKVVMVTPCNHMCFCIGCANAAIDKGVSDAKCPVCRGDVKEFVKVFS